MDQEMAKQYQVSKTACVTFAPPSTKIGQIVDISIRGLTFKYIVGDGASINSSELNILLPHHGFSLRNVPFQIISDEVAEEPGSNGNVRRCEVRFGDLTDAQRAQIERFIQHHTTGAGQA